MNEQILQRKSFRQFEFLIVKAAGKLWLRLSESESDKVQQFWSTNETEQSAAVQLMRMLESRLSTQASFDDAVLYFPENWEYWGGGLPAPLLSFLRSDDFQKQLSPHKIEHNQA